MKTLCLQLICLISMTMVAAGSSGSDLLLIEPVSDSSGKPLMQEAPDGGQVPVVRRAAESGFAASVRSALSSGFGREMVELQQAVSAQYRRDNPVWLMLSVEDGGFARHGFYLEAEGERSFHDVWYVDMVVDEDSVASGQFEEIWSHETVHVLLALVMPELPRIANAMHQSMAITDDVIAFDEGLAEAMQPLVRQRSANESLRRQDRGLNSSGYTEYWLSRQDQALRHYGVRHNLLVHPVLEPPGGNTLFERYRRTQASTLLHRYQLRTASQLLASEGYIATIFYRLLQQEDIAEQVRQQFPKLKSFQDWQLVMLRLLAVVHQSDLQSGTGRLTADILEQWRSAYPQDWALLVDTVLNSSFGATADLAAHQHFEETAEAGLQGDMQGLIAGLPAARTWLSGLREDILAGKESLFGAAGSPLWIENSAFPIGAALWSGERDQPLRINLNTAIPIELETLPTINADKAAAIVAERRRGGDYGSIEDLCRRTGLPDTDCRSLQDMQFDPTRSSAG